MKGCAVGFNEDALLSETPFPFAEPKVKDGLLCSFFSDVEDPIDTAGGLICFVSSLSSIDLFFLELV